MSAQVRQDLADAANTVQGVSVSPYYRQTTKPGSGFVRLDVMNRDDSGFGFINTWQVCILLSQEMKTAEVFIDAHAEELVNALAGEGAVISAQPVSLVVDGASIPTLIITVAREKD